MDTKQIISLWTGIIAVSIHSLVDAELFRFIVLILITAAMIYTFSKFKNLHNAISISLILSVFIFMILIAIA